MGPPELLALSLGLSVGVAGLAWIGGRLVETLSADPRLRDRAWAVALAAPALPPAAIGLMLLTPAPVREIAPIVTPTAPDFTIPLQPLVGAVATPAAGLDPTAMAWAVLALAGLLALARTAALASRAWRLTRMIRSAAPPDAAIAGMVEAVARDLEISPPLVGVSEAAPEALLAGVVRPRLLLPSGLVGTGDLTTARAVIAHELAHLKRGDHRALWIEEGLLALLAINPLAPVLRAGRAAAREEACDALALAGATTETRRVYAETLIEALRSRAGPQALPALGFTSARRRTAMRRLKAVMTPAAPAGGRIRLVVVAASLALMAAAGGATAAIAAHREVETRFAAARTETQQPSARARELLNGTPMPEGLPIWALNPRRVEIRTPPTGNGELNLVLPFTGTTPVSVNGRRMPAGFPITAINPEAVAEMDMVGEHMMVRLKSEIEFRGGRTEVSQAADAEEAAARGAADAEERDRFRRASAADYKRYCASGEPGEAGFCAGVMFGHLARAADLGLCVPDDLRLGANDTGRLGAFVDRGKAEVARLTPRGDEGASEYAARALRQAYPCDGASAEMAAAAIERMRAHVPLTVSVELEGRPLSVQGDETLRVVLTDENGAVMNTHGTINSGSGRASGPLGPLGMAIAPEDFPDLGEATRVYTLTGEIRGPDRVLRYVAEPVTIRLAPGSRAFADLRPMLTFRPA